jgi:hypothetical protein
MMQNSKPISRILKSIIGGAFFLALTPILHAETVDDIRDIKGPIHLYFHWMWLIYLLIGIFVFVAAIWFYRLWKKRVIKKAKLPHEMALEKLASAEQLMISENAREFSIVVSEAIREYIENRFQEKAANRTTEEFLHHLLSHTDSPLVPYSDFLQDFLNHCDMAKFAKGTLSREQMDSMLQSARSLVEQTKPIDQAKKSTAQGKIPK